MAGLFGPTIASSKRIGLLPEDANARARAIAWMFAALNTVEPPIVDRGTTWLPSAAMPDLRAPAADTVVRPRQAPPSAPPSTAPALTNPLTASRAPGTAFNPLGSAENP